MNRKYSNKFTDNAIRKKRDGGIGYECPGCHEFTPEENYVINGITFPLRGEGFYEWDEIHLCRKCKIFFQFKNGNQEDIVAEGIEYLEGEKIDD